VLVLVPVLVLASSSRSSTGTGTSTGPTGPVLVQGGTVLVLVLETPTLRHCGVWTVLLLVPLVALVLVLILVVL
jgi:hypothetical protein